MPNMAWQGYNVRTIAPYTGDFPDRGHLWVVGPENEIGHWYQHHRFEHVTLIYNQHAPPLFYRCMHDLSLAGSHEVNISYISSSLAREIGLPGTISPPAFNPRPFIDAYVDNDRCHSADFNVGKVTRDIRLKHHPDDPSLYEALLKHGIHIDLVGATCISDRLASHPAMRVRGEIHRSEMPNYLMQLDCLIYRTCNRKPEGFGLCILEAMATGLPVIAARSGGYADIIRSGENGFLFDRNEEAVEIIMTLKEKPDLKHQIGVLAQKTIQQLYNSI